MISFKFTKTVAKGVRRDRPGIYEWKIQGAGSYIGKYKNISRPEAEYRRNVEKLLQGRPYRKAKPAKFRRIHHALANAVKTRRKIQLIILENPPAEEINKRERELIAKRGSLNGSGNTVTTKTTKPRDGQQLVAARSCHTRACTLTNPRCP